MQQSLVKVGQNGSQMDFRELVSKYFNEELSALSPLTIEARKIDLKKFFQFFLKCYNSSDLSSWYPGDTKLYLEFLMSQDYSINYLNRNLSSVRSFGTWLWTNKYINQDPIKHIKEYKFDEPKPKAIDDLTLNRLFKTADLLLAKPRSKDSQDARNITIFQVLLKSGLRIEEILRLKLIQFVDNKFINVIAKGAKIRTAVTINKETADLVRDYIDNYRTDRSEYLFTNRYGNKLSRNGLGKALNKVCSLASATFCEPDEKIKIHPHLFRHTHAKKFYEKTKDPVLTAKRLGHSSLQYVSRYATPSNEAIDKIIDEL